MAEIKYIIPFTYKWEGGLSNATTDAASKNPSPYTINGKTGWHTNKGITYPVFKTGATKYGYKDSLENFRDMPHDIWLKIAKGGYWDKLNLDTVKSQAVANVMFSWCWGSGYAWIPRVSAYLKANGITWVGGTYSGKKLTLAPDFKQLAAKLNELSDKVGEKKVFEDLIEQKKQFLLSLKAANPGGIYTKGWMNRLEDLRGYSSTLLGKTMEATKETVINATEVVKKNPLKTVVIAAAVTVLIYTGYKLIKKNI